MAEIVRVGVCATLAADQTSTSLTWSRVDLVDADGNDVSGGWVEDPPGIAIDVIQFAELDDGERVTAGGGRLEAAYRDRALLEQDLRDFVVEDPEVAEIEREDQGDDYEPELQPLVDALAARGIATGAEALAALPVVIEVDEGVRAKFA